MGYFVKPGRPLGAAVAVAAAFMLSSPCASALGLMEAYQAALKNDPTYRSAYFASEAGKENRILGRSNLLPAISGSYSGTQSRNTITVGDASGPRDYFSRSAVVQLRQPLLNLDGYARYKQGAAQSNYAAAQFESQQQEVISRLVNAYFDVLYKGELLALAKVERDVYVEQRKVNDRLFEKGEGTRTDMLESQARLDSSEAAVLETQDALNTSRTTLAAIIGGDLGELDRLSPNFETRPADTLSFEAWKNIALERNPDIKTLTYGVEIARQEVNKSRAGHTPRVDFVASYSKSTADSIQTYNQDTLSRNIGIQINIPIYSGGAVNAQTRQAVANQEKAKSDLQGQADKVLTELRKDYDAMLSGVARIAALKKAVASSELLVKATEQSVKGGVRINLDVLNATQQLYTNKRDLAQARYNYLLNTLRMRSAAGTLAEADVREIAPYFQPAQ
ncbi:MULTISPECIES: TolC family outer membrane protein [unclassified Duganella]|uniref:TolC family outer membrane protein n=1 Tax=unclassified Duganella TaxID=2636909 RepID=UPI000E3422FA|nr:MULTISPECIES: TolC family outer membrane protein [unclassified Duganella]RFP11896.1 type I secretion protein TolC [Duganella sp. BJB475]RFP31462.1 type I secretion protein TolC [Duganella sp. BJB476]